MNDLKIAEDNASQKELFEKITLICPKCESQKRIKVPSKVITQSRKVITIGIPVGLICDHSFQAYIDKHSDVRGYQVVDFLIPKTEFYQSGIQKDAHEEINNLNPIINLPIFQDIVTILRNRVDNREILGSAMFTKKGIVLYSSIPQNALLDTIREFEVRNEAKLHSITKMFLELQNNQKVCSEYLELHDLEVIIVLIFSEMVNFAIGNMYLRDVVKKIENLM